MEVNDDEIQNVNSSKIKMGVDFAVGSVASSIPGRGAVE